MQAICSAVTIPQKQMKAMGLPLFERFAVIKEHACAQTDEKNNHGRPRISVDIEQLVCRMARENEWGSVPTGNTARNIIRKDLLGGLLKSYRKAA